MSSRARSSTSPLRQRSTAYQAPMANVRDKVPLEEEEDQEEEDGADSGATGHGGEGGSHVGTLRPRSRSPSEPFQEYRAAGAGNRDRAAASRGGVENWELMPVGSGAGGMYRSSSSGGVAGVYSSTAGGIGLSPLDSISDMLDEVEVYPPKNFAMVYQGVFRSAYPTKKSFEFLRKLGLKSVIYLCQEEYSGQVRQFYSDQAIQIHQHGVSGNKEPFVDISDEMIYSALQRLLDCRNHPILIHCNQGKHRTGSLVGCLRAVNHWSMAAIFDEYRRFAGTKARRADQQFIELFHRKYPTVKTDPRYHPAWFYP